MTTLSSIYNSPGGSGGGSGADEKTKVSAIDTTADYLESKLTEGYNITLTKNNSGANETLTIATGEPYRIINGISELGFYSSGGQLTLKYNNNPYLVVGSNFAFGLNSLPSVTGTYNVGLGEGTLRNNTTGSYNISIGHNSAFNLIGGVRNIAIGVNALSAGTGHARCIALGNEAGMGMVFEDLNFIDNGSNNVADSIFIGTSSGLNTFANHSISIGVNCNDYTYGSLNNLVIGYMARTSRSEVYAQTLFNQNGAVGFGSNNVVVGDEALRQRLDTSQSYSVWQEGGAISADNNTVVGSLSGYNRQGVIDCSSLGYKALSLVPEESTATQILHQVTALGSLAGSINPGWHNCTLIGYNAQASGPTVDNQITLGNSSITSLRCQVTAITALSDARDKTNIVDLPIGLDFVSSLRPVKFDWNMRDGAKVGIPDYGFIAQELQQAQVGNEWLDLVLDNNPERLEATPGKLIPVLVKAIQELSFEVKNLKSRVIQLESSQSIS